MKLDGEVAQKFEKPVYIREYNLAEHLFVSQHVTKSYIRASFLSRILL